MHGLSTAVIGLGIVMSQNALRSLPMSLIQAIFLAYLLVGFSAEARAQDRGSPPGEWRSWGGDNWNTRYSTADRINAANFGDLEVAWLWRGDNFGPQVDYVLRATPIYADGILYTVAGQRRTLVAIDPSTGETLWTYREPHTTRHDRSERANYGRGVTYAEVEGRGVIFMVTPAFFLHALDAKTGRPLEGFGKKVPIEGFPETGTVDLLADLGHAYDVEFGIPTEVGSITNAHPPTVVNGVVIVPNAGPRSRYQTRHENVPGDILAYDARTGEHRWKFNVIPRPGEFGHDTWESDAWSYTGNANSWPGLAADAELGIVYVPTDAITNDVYAGFHPGNNLFANSILALDVQTGRRIWHFQTIHRDVWDFDIPLPPNLLDVTVDGRDIPAVVLTTKQAFAYAFDRRTGEPIWPIEERPVPPSEVPGELLSPTQPHPTRPLAYEMQGLTTDDLIDFTPELREMALEIVKQYRISPALFNPPLQRDNPHGIRAAVLCPSSNGGSLIRGGTVADPESGIMYVASIKTCGARVLVPGEDVDDPESIFTFGRTVARWGNGPGGGVAGPEGLPLYKPPYGRITAIDMNTGEHLWWIPNGDSPDWITNHPRLRGLDIPNTGQASHATPLVTTTLLMYGEGSGGRARFHAVDKRSGERVGTIELPAPTDAAPMTFLHEGRQYIVTAVSGGEHGLPGSLVALRLP